MAYQAYPTADPAAAAAAASPYQPSPYAAPQYPAAYPPAYPGYPQPYSDPNELRTLFLTGFPTDVKERELNNLLRFLPGYEASQLHLAGVKSPQAQGFALFNCGASAQNALRSVTNLVFDEGYPLRCEMARKNMYIKDDSSTKRSRYEGQYGAYGAAPGSYWGAPPAQPQGYTPVSNTKDNPPCNTLFIGNLGDGVDETELRSIFGGQPGFRQIKLNRGPRGITCFVEFSDVASAMAVHASQQGAVLQSSDRGGIRIQYSKNPFGKKRDYGSFNDQSPYSSTPLSASAYQQPNSAQGGQQTETSAVQSFEQVPASAPGEQAAAPAAFEHPPNGQTQDGPAPEQEPQAEGFAGVAPSAADQQPISQA